MYRSGGGGDFAAPLRGLKKSRMSGGGKDPESGRKEKILVNSSVSEIAVRITVSKEAIELIKRANAPTTGRARKAENESPLPEIRQKGSMGQGDPGDTTEKRQQPGSNNP